MAFGIPFFLVLLVIGIIVFVLFVIVKITEIFYDWSFYWESGRQAEAEREAKERLPRARQKAEELLGKARQKAEWGWTTLIEDEEIEVLAELLVTFKHTGTYQDKEAVAKEVSNRLHELLYGKNKNEDDQTFEKSDQDYDFPDVPDDFPL